MNKSTFLFKALMLCCLLLGALAPQRAAAFKMMPGSGECRTEIQWGLFECVYPRGADEETFLGKVGVYNSYSCSPMDYYISAVDPVTGVVNGTVDPATGPLGAGWNTIVFSYNPDPGVTAVRFIITFTCGGKAGYKVCRSTLGEFDNLDDRRLYPCRDYFKMAQAEAQQPALLIAPNPVTDQAGILYTITDRKENAAYNISVVNMMGQQVAQYTITDNNGIWQYPAGLLPAGTYIVRLQQDGGNIATQRMLIAH